MSSRIRRAQPVTLSVQAPEPVTPRILVIDSETGFLQLLRHALGQFSVSTAEDPVTALKLLGREFFDLILIDLSMPELDGVELVHEIHSKKRFANTPILVIATSVDLRKHISRMDTVAFVLKPLWQEHLLKTVAEVLNRTGHEQAVPSPSLPLKIPQAPAPRKRASLIQTF